MSHGLLDAIADYNIAQVKKALEYDIDAVYFGDDLGQQHGLLMGYEIWKEFIYPRIQRMYATVRKAGKTVFIHSCGDVDELFDDLVEIGVGIFNPFQPEVMYVAALLESYHGRLSFWGGISTQQTMPYGTPEDDRREVRNCMSWGAVADTFSCHRIRWKVMCHWRTSWLSSKKHTDCPASDNAVSPFFLIIRLCLVRLAISPTHSPNPAAKTEC